MRIFEEHDAIVTRNFDDDEGIEGLRGSVFFQSDTLIEDTEYPIPATPCFPYASAAFETANGNELTGGAGFFFVPKPDDFITVRLEDAIEHPNPTYLCMFYNDVTDIAREWKKNYANRMGWKTNSGHILLFDDTKKQQLVKLEHTFGSNLVMGSNGNISLKSRNVTKRDRKDEAKDTEAATFHELLLDYENKLISLTDKFNNNVMTFDENGMKFVDKNTNQVILSSDGIKLQDVNGHILDMKAGSVDLTAAGAMNLTASGNLVATGAQIQLNGSTGDVLTTITDPVVDLITGVPTVGVPTVKAG